MDVRKIVVVRVRVVVLRVVGGGKARVVEGIRGG